MNKAFEADLAPTPKIVLIALCDYANDEGRCFPSLATLSTKTNVKKTNLTYILKAFEALKVVSRTTRKRNNGSNASTIYQIKNIENINPDHYIKAYQNIKRYQYKSQNEQVQKNSSVNKVEDNSEQLKPSCFNHQFNLSSNKEREEFNLFRKRVLKDYRGKPLVKNIEGYLPETVISISAIGYLHNNYSSKDLSAEDAIHIWQWLYVNPHMVGNIE